MKSTILFTITLFTAIALFVGGFFVPPMGAIDGSILKAAGELLGFAALAQIPIIVHKGADVTIQHGNTSVTVSNPDGEEETE